MKKNILFVYPNMMIGGSTTSLISLLEKIDYSQFNVDLLLGENKGPMLDYLPTNVNVLPNAYKYKNRVVRIIHLLLKPKKLIIVLISIIKFLGHKNNLIKQQENAYVKAQQDYANKKYYDYAVAYLEFWSTNYVALNTNSAKKIAWFHMDYLSTGMNPKKDLELYNNFYKIILVSDKCKISFDTSFPQLINKTFVFENIVSKKTILQRSIDFVDFSIDSKKINIVTSCRIDNSSKALDRSLKQFYKLINTQSVINLKWYIIGDGPDYENISKLITKFSLNSYVCLLGSKTNPFPYIKKMDVFFLPSKYEGKPMVITESMMLGIPCLVTNFLSSRELIKNMYNGIIIDNSEDGIFDALCNLNENKYNLLSLKNNLFDFDIDYTSTINTLNNYLFD